jgi:hypothetical protein
MAQYPHVTQEWGVLESEYVDEFGPVAPALYEAAGRIWRRSLTYAARSLPGTDQASTRTLLIKAAAQVTGSTTWRDRQVNDLDGYLFQTFRHLVLAELEKANNRLRLETEARLDAEWVDQSNNVERRILLGELVAAMDGWTRAVFMWLSLDYTFNEIAGHLDMDPRVVRNKYKRRLAALMKQVGD